MSQAGSNSSGGGGAGALNTLTGDIGGAVAPVLGNINLLGAGDLYNLVASAGTLTVTPTPGAYPITPYVVGPVGQAGYQTIQSAINAASAAGGGTVWILPGTYTENLTFADNVNLVGNNIEGRLQAAVIGLGIPASLTLIDGNHTFAVNGGVYVEGIAFTAAAGDIVSATIPVGTTGLLAFKYCYFSSTVAKGIVFDGTGGFLIGSVVETNMSTAAAPCLEFKANVFGNLYNTNLQSNAVAVLVSGPGANVNFQQNCELDGQLEIADAASSVSSIGTLFNPAAGDSCVTFSAAGTFNSSLNTFNSSAASGYYIDGAGNYIYSGDVLQGSAQNIDPLISQTPRLMRPVATAADIPLNAVFGTAAFDSNNFDVSDGFVSLAPNVGQATLVGGTVTVAHASVNVGAKIFVSMVTPGGTPGFLYTSTIVPGVSFDINSTNVLDTSTVNWWVASLN